MNAALAGEFAATGLTLYAAHHVGDYWVQTDHQARHKGDAGYEGRIQCIAHVAGYLATQVVLLAVVNGVLDMHLNVWAVVAALLVSGVTHYLADRREHGLMFKLARLLPGKAAFMELGRPRTGWIWAQAGDETVAPRDDNPQLATGAWALDQAWHIFWGVFVAALLAVTL